MGINEGLATGGSSLEPSLTDRIRARLKELGKSASAASVEAGLGNTAIRDILNGRTKSPQLATLVSLTTPLDCTLAYLTGEADEPDMGPIYEVEYRPRQEPLTDFLEAGSFRTSLWQSENKDLQEREGGLIFNDLRLSGWHFSLFKIKDNSMDQLGIIEGDMITGAHGEVNKKSIVLTPGLIVIAKYWVEAIEATEISLRQIEVSDGVTRLVTRSRRNNAPPIILGDRVTTKKSLGVNIYRTEAGGQVWIQAVAVRVMRTLPAPA